MISGIINVNKPSGVTSFTVVNKIKKILGTKKVGHLGTLDPLASGVLPVAVNKATKLFDYYLKKEKEYIAEFEFSYETTTLDAEGEIINKNEKIISTSDLIKVIPLLVGEINQVPPAFSAKKVNGVRSYDLARNGQSVELKPSKVFIKNIEILEEIKQNKFKLKINCGAGTYVRSIGRDLAKMLDTYATMTSLIRTKSGEFNIENSLTIEQIEILKEKAIKEIDLGFPKITLDETGLFKLSNGVLINYKSDGCYQIYDKEKLIFITKCENNKMKVLYRF